MSTTKAYSAQLAAMYCLAVQFAKVREKNTEEQYGYYISELLTIPEKMQKILEDKERIQWFAAKYAMHMMCSSWTAALIMQSACKEA